LNKKEYYLFYDPDLIHVIINFYINGMPIDSIGSYFGMNGEEINFILDHFIPYLD
jgi:hypothetical protein